MTLIVAGTLDKLPGPIATGLGTFRHEVFVRRLGWELPLVNAAERVEWDQFDGAPTIHLAHLDEHGRINGCARLMPTTGRYLLREVFPELAGPAGPPVSEHIWELSRLAGATTTARGARSGAAPGMRIFACAIALAGALGATEVIGVVSPAMDRVYRRAGAELRPLQPAAPAAPATARTTDVLARAIDITPATFSRLQCDPAGLLAAIQWSGAPPAVVHVADTALAHQAPPGA